MSVIRHCQDCGKPLDRSEIAVEVREWDALHASNNERGREVERLARELAGAIDRIAELETENADLRDQITNLVEQHRMRTRAAPQGGSKTMSGDDNRRYRIEVCAACGAHATHKTDWTGVNRFDCQHVLGGGETEWILVVPVNQPPGARAPRGDQAGARLQPGAR